MVHLVRKKIGNHEYLYLQKSCHIKGKGLKRTKHIAYLGKSGKYTPSQVNEILTMANNGPRNRLLSLIKKCNEDIKKQKKD